MKHIAADNALQPEQKVNKLVEPGVPAVPFILKKIESGDEQLFPAIAALTKDTKHAAADSIANKKEWAARSKSAFEKLKTYVLDQK